LNLGNLTFSIILKDEKNKKKGKLIKIL
jgi:hypothetical protein